MEKRKDITNIYIPEDFRSTFEAFKKICDREGSSSSEKIRFFIQDYVQQHEVPNPQTVMQSFNGQLAKPIMLTLPECPARLWIDPERHEIYCDKIHSIKFPAACYTCNDRERFVRMFGIGQYKPSEIIKKA